MYTRDGKAIIGFSLNTHLLIVKAFPKFLSVKRLSLPPCYSNHSRLEASPTTRCQFVHPQMPFTYIMLQKAFEQHSHTLAHAHCLNNIVFVNRRRHEIFDSEDIVRNV